MGRKDLSSKTLECTTDKFEVVERGLVRVVEDLKSTV